MSEENWKRDLLKFALRNFGSLAEKLGLSEFFRPKMKKAGIPYTGEEYASLLLLLSTIIPVTISFFASLVLILLGASPVDAFFYFIAITFGLGLLIFLVGYFYPDAKISEKKKNIMNNLPFATIYMATLSSAGMSTDRIFKILSHFKEFGEISYEAGRITRDVEMLGMDIVTALEKAADRTPSSQFRELLWGMRSTITTGGDLNRYLIEKSKSYMAEYRRFLDKFVDQLSLLMEVYITAVIVGSIFFIIMGTILGLMGGGEPILLVKLIVYFGIPLLSIMFMILVAGLSPE